MILDFSFEQVMRLSSIKRWGIIEMSRSQSVAEHSYNVAMISAMIISHFPEDGPTLNRQPNLMWDTLSWALVHDLPELVTGDIPTPVKGHIGESISDMEKKLFPRLTQRKESTNLETLAITKVADLIEAIQFAKKFCVDSRKDEIISEMEGKIGQIIVGFAPSEFAHCLFNAVNEIWKDGKIPLKNT